jgi:predicted amidohydrolase
MRAAAVQLNSTADVDANVEAAGRLVGEAAGAGAELVVLPEKWSLLAIGDELLERAETIDGPAVTAARSWARELGVTLLAGSISERLEGEEMLANTSILIGADGEIAATYRKIHMFDVDVGEVRYRESELERPGDRLVLAEAGGLKLGMTVCYDLRFPELYRMLALAGADLVAVPSAFTAVTGRDHWEVLVRARAIESQLAVIAPNQVGTAPPHFDSWGHSMLVDAWGRVLASVEGREPGIAVAEIDFDEQRRIRREVPSLANRRPGAYRFEPALEHHV